MELFRVDEGNLGAQLAVALGQMGEPAVLPLIGLLGHAQSHVRLHAMLGLAHTQDARAEAALQLAMQDGDPKMGAFARQALTILRSRGRQKGSAQ